MQPSPVVGFEAPVGGPLGAGLGPALGALAALADIAGKGSYAVVVTGLGAGLGRRMALPGAQGGGVEPTAMALRTLPLVPACLPA